MKETYFISCKFFYLKYINSKSCIFFISIVLCIVVFYCSYTNFICIYYFDIFLLNYYILSIIKNKINFFSLHNINFLVNLLFFIPIFPLIILQSWYFRKYLTEISSVTFTVIFLIFVFFLFNVRYSSKKKKKISHQDFRYKFKTFNNTIIINNS